jgi:micrococcal nuclease
MKSKRIHYPTAFLTLAFLLLFSVLRKHEDRDQETGTPAPPAAPAGSVLTGRAASIADGDSLELRIKGRRKVGVRLFGIDAPEGRQTRGRQAREALKQQIDGKTVELKVVETDQYGRLVGDLYHEGAWINEAMVVQGWAWHYTRYSHSAALARAEREARARRLGLWRDKEPMPPWIWRQQNPRN